MAFLRETVFIFRRLGLWLFILMVFSSYFDQQISGQLEELLQSDDGVGPRLWLLAGLSMVNGLVFPVLISALTMAAIFLHHKWEHSTLAFLGRTLNQLYIETLRSWGAALLWGLLLVVPGFIRLLQLIFVPFVVTSLKPYEMGQVDALERSWMLMKRHPFLVLGTLLAFHFLIPLAFTDVLDPWRLFSRTPVPALGCAVFDLILTVWSTQVLFRIFDRCRREAGDAYVFDAELLPAAAPMAPTAAT